MHVVAYRWAAPQLHELRVLDFGCGTGYGTYELSKAAASIVGVDVSAESVDHARFAYNAPNLEFAAISPVEAEALPFPDEYCCAVMSNQVI
jgi:ubiquinone/menaquinone biosynthesis C-methylase UbiE